MNKFIVPEQDIDRLAIEEAVRNDAWLILPHEIDILVIGWKATDMGFEDVIKCCYWDDMDDIWEENIVLIYSDQILQEMIKSKNNNLIISMFMESDVK